MSFRSSAVLLLAVLTAVTVVLGMRMMGALLISSLSSAGIPILTTKPASP